MKNHEFLPSNTWLNEMELISQIVRVAPEQPPLHKGGQIVRVSGQDIFRRLIDSNIEIRSKIPNFRSKRSPVNP